MRAWLFLALKGREVNSQGCQPLGLDRNAKLKPWKGDSDFVWQTQLSPFQGLRLGGEIRSRGCTPGY